MRVYGEVFCRGESNHDREPDRPQSLGGDLGCRVALMSSDEAWKCEMHRVYDTTRGFQDEPKCWKGYMGTPGSCRMVRILVVPDPVALVEGTQGGD